ncbi:Cysteine-rich repeat secretory protein 26 [Nymphaea thermarum]|nr:Cysteine-rich repeat secretory protein 26 [Nymphaea thermarum]
MEWDGCSLLKQAKAPQRSFWPIPQLETVYSVMGLTLLRIGILLLLLSIHVVLLLSIHVGRAMSSNLYLTRRCSIAANYTDRDEFEVNMDSVLSTLKNDAPSIGFLNTTKGQGPEEVYGLVQCRGDVGEEECKSCISRSTIEIVQYCPNTKDAIIWFEKCQLRYSNTNFFGLLNLNDSVSWTWVNSPVESPKEFYGPLVNLLKNLTSAATTEPSRSMFAGNATEYTIRQTLYGLVQCTRDTSRADCKECLETAISQINSGVCRDSKGCELLKGSYRVRHNKPISSAQFSSSKFKPFTDWYRQHYVMLFILSISVAKIAIGSSRVFAVHLRSLSDGEEKNPRNQHFRQPLHDPRDHYHLGVGIGPGPGRPVRPEARARAGPFILPGQAGPGTGQFHHKSGPGGAGPDHHPM